MRLWARNETFARHIHETRENSRLLPHVKLPAGIEVTADAARALRAATVVVICIPTRGLREAMQNLATLIPRQAILASAVKGIENETLLRPSQIIQQIVGPRPVVVLGGPCHAEEITARKPASIVAACESLDAAERIQSLLSMESLRVYSNADQQGVELAGALKNVIAIAAGICDGLEFGDNAKAALLTRGSGRDGAVWNNSGSKQRNIFWPGWSGRSCSDLQQPTQSQSFCRRSSGARSDSCKNPGIHDSRCGRHLYGTQCLPSFTVSMASICRSPNRSIACSSKTRMPREATVELMQRPLKLE